MTVKRKSNPCRTGTGIFAIFLFVCAGAFWTGPAAAEVNVNIGVFAPPPPMVMPGPPPMAVIPGPAYVYYAPDVPAGLFFYQGSWWRPHEGHWFRAHSYRGPWRYIDNNHTPTPILRLPADYRKVPPGHYKMTHGQMKKHWKEWEKDRRWDHTPRGRHAIAGPYPAGRVQHGGGQARQKGRR